MKDIKDITRCYHCTPRLKCTKCLLDEELCSPKKEEKKKKKSIFDYLKPGLGPAWTEEGE